MDTSRHQKVDVFEPDLDQIWLALPELVRYKLGSLTDMQKDYVLLVSVGVGSNDAYMRAYNRGPDTRPDTNRTSAVKLAGTTAIKAALEVIRKGSVLVGLIDSSAPMMTRQWVLDRLAVEADDANKKNSGSVRVRALELIGRSQGMFEDVQVIKDDRPTDMDEARQAFTKLLARVAPALLGDEEIQLQVGGSTTEDQGTD